MMTTQNRSITSGPGSCLIRHLGGQPAHFLLTLTLTHTAHRVQPRDSSWEPVCLHLFAIVG